MQVLWRAARWLFLGIALLAGLLLLPFLRDQADRVGTTFAEANAAFLLLAAVAAAGWVVGFGVLIHEAGAAIGRRLPPGRSAIVASALQFVYAFPAGAVAGLVYETRAVEQMGVPRGTAMLVVGLETVVFYGTFLIFLLVALVVLTLTHSASGHLLLGAALFMALLGGLAIAALYVLGDPIRAEAAHQRLVWLFGKGRGIGRSVDEMALAVQRIREAPGILAKPAVAALVHWSAVIVALGCVFLAFGVRPVLPVVVTGFSVAFFVGRLTPIPGGLGAMEGTMTAVLAALGLPFEKALAITVAFRVITFLLPVAVGFVAHSILVRLGVAESARFRPRRPA